MQSPNIKSQDEKDLKKAPPIIPEDTFGYRPDEARVRLRVGKTKMAKMIREGVVESVLIGRTRIVTRRSIEALLFGQKAA